MKHKDIQFKSKRTKVLGTVYTGVEVHRIDSEMSRLVE